MGIGEQATRLAFPFSVSADFLAMASGEGQYKDMDVFDRAGKFLMQKMPGFRVLETQIASWALGLEEAESKKLDADIKAANAWKRSTFGWTKVRENKENDTRREFRVNMRKAIKILTEEGKTDEYWNARQTAFESLDEKLSEKKQRIAGFIRSRKILTNGDGGELTPDQEDAIIKRIGEEAYDRLEAYDDMMDKAAP